MARYASPLTIAALAMSLLFAGTAAGQFPIKIKIPKIPKPTMPTTSPDSTDRGNTSSAEAVSSDSGANTSASGANAARGEVRGIPIPGARITFSNNPDGSNPKTSFTSSEYIYGHLDLGGKTVFDAFGLKNQTDVPYYYISYDLVIYKPDQTPYEGNWGGSRNFTMVTKEDAQKTYWNFDVLPDPARISTIKVMLASEKDFSNRGIAGIYTKWYDAASAQSAFPQNGTYTIDVTVWGDAYDDWGKPTFVSERKPTVSSQFAFIFSGTDGQKLVANQVKAIKTLEDAKNASEMYRTMPDWWVKGIPAPDPKLAPARLVPMIKEYIGRWNLTYMKHMIYPLKGPAWAIEKNDLGIPRYRRFTSAIYIIYKDPKENACQVGYLEMTEPYAGGGTYSQPVLSGISDVKYIDCAVVK